MQRITLCWRRAVITLLVAAFGTLTAGTLPGCHTTEGLGQDIEHLGDSIEDAAD